MNGRRKNRRQRPSAITTVPLQARCDGSDEVILGMTVAVNYATTPLMLSGIIVNDGGVNRPCTGATVQPNGELSLNFSGATITSGDTITFNNQGALTFYHNAVIPPGTVVVCEVP